MASVCIHCKNNIKDSEVYYFCDGCQKPVHGPCTDLSASEIKCLQLRKRVMKFYCNQCNEGLSGIPDLVASVKIMREELAELKNAISARPSGAAGSNSDATPDLVSQVINECREREVRKVNAVIFGLPEAPTGGSMPANRDFDQNTVKTVLSTVNPDVDLSGIKFYRLGKPTTGPSKPRPVKVVFASSSHVEAIVSRAGKLKTNPEFGDVYVNYDKTPCQLEEFRRLRAELQVRLSGGEENLRISFVDGIHRITKSRRNTSSLN